MSCTGDDTIYPQALTDPSRSTQSSCNHPLTNIQRSKGRSSGVATALLHFFKQRIRRQHFCPNPMFPYTVSSAIICLQHWSCKNILHMASSVKISDIFQLEYSFWLISHCQCKIWKPWLFGGMAWGALILVRVRRSKRNKIPPFSSNLANCIQHQSLLKTECIHILTPWLFASIKQYCCISLLTPLKW